MQPIELYRNHRDEYRAMADECRAVAGRSRWLEQRTVLIGMAQMWDGLASLRAAQIARQSGVEEIERTLHLELS
jgi:hypothetical protein